MGLLDRLGARRSDPDLPRPAALPAAPPVAFADEPLFSTKAFKKLLEPLTTCESPSLLGSVRSSDRTSVSLASVSAARSSSRTFTPISSGICAAASGRLPVFSNADFPG
jgi:hypothetical protein